MANPTRNAGGFSTVTEANSWLYAYDRPDPTKWKEYLENFNQPARDAAATALGDVFPAGWTHTATNGVATNTSAGLVLTMAGADNDLSQAYLTAARFAAAADKQIFFEAKVTVGVGGGTIGQQEFFVGLSSVSTGASFSTATGVAPWTMDDAIGFGSFDGDADWDCICRSSDSESTQASVLTMVDATTYVLSVYSTGTAVKFYIDGSLVGTIEDNIPTAAMSPMLFIKAGEAQASVLTTEYIWVAVER